VIPETPVHRTDAETRRSVFLASILSSFATPFMGSAVNVALPTLGRDLGLDAVSLSWVATSYLLAAAVALVPAGRIADLRGRKKIFLSGLSVFTAASLLCGVTNTGAQLILARVVQGIGGAMIFGTGMAIVTSVFRREERGKVFGYTVSAVYLGLSVGPFVGGLLTDSLGWRSVFIVIAPVGLAAIVYSLIHMKGEWFGSPGGRFDAPGSILYGLGLFGLMYGFSQIARPGGSWFALCGAVLLAGFVWWEYQTPSPVLDLRLVAQNRVFALSNLAAFINYSATFGVTFLLSIYLQVVKGFDAKTAGLVLIAQPVVMAALSPFAGKLSDRVEPRIVASTGMALTSVGLVFLAFLSETTPTALIIGSLIVLGAGFALFSSPNTNAVMSSVSAAHYGTASAFSGTMRLVGQVFSMGIVTLAISLKMGTAALGPEQHESLLAVDRIVFVLFAVLCAGGTLASLVRGNVHGTEGPQPREGAG
jgi:EmrB/QacA subfamily drug resistance transporter